MAFGARQEDGVWRLCERKGRTIKRIAAELYPAIEVKFKGRAAAEKCAHQLNDDCWPRYAKQRHETMDETLFWDMIDRVYTHGGITKAEYEEICK